MTIFKPNVSGGGGPSPVQGIGTTPTPIYILPSPVNSGTVTTPFNIGDTITIPASGKYMIIIYAHVDSTSYHGYIDFTITRSGTIFYLIGAVGSFSSANFSSSTAVNSLFLNAPAGYGPEAYIYATTKTLCYAMKPIAFSGQLGMTPTFPYLEISLLQGDVIQFRGQATSTTYKLYADEIDVLQE